MKLIDRTILRDLGPLFLLGVMAFTSLILGVGGIYRMIRMATDHNVNILLVASAFIFKLPEIITYTLPMSTLFCILLVFNRMSADLEITALRAGGVGFLRVMAPAVLFAFLVSLFALLMNDRVVPAANGKFNSLITGIETGGVLEKRHVLVTEENDDGQIERVILIQQIKGRRLSGINIQEFKDERPQEYITAEYGHWSENDTLLLHEVEAYRFNRKSDSNAGATYINTRDTMEVTLSQSLEKMRQKQKQSEEMTIRDLRLQIEQLKRENLEPHLIRKVMVDFYSKLAIPFASLAFALIAAPLGLKPQRASNSVGLGVSVIIIFFYYIFQQIFRGLGGAFMAPALAAWMPNLLVFAVGIFLCARADK